MSKSISKNGFTLIEIIIVMVIISVIIIIAIPSVIEIYNDTKLNMFLDDAKAIYKNIETSYNSDFMEDTIKVSRYCDTPGSFIKKLRIKKPDDISYDIELSTNGEIIKFYVVNNTYQLLLASSNVQISDVVAENVQKLENFEYDCNGLFGIYCNVEHLPCVVVPTFKYNVIDSNL